VIQPPIGADSIIPETEDRLGIIERHLQQLLADNWEQTELGQEWESMRRILKKNSFGLLAAEGKR
jgi:hypothetical protein